MHHQLAMVLLAKPEVLRQIAMWRWKIRRMQITELIRVVTPTGLHQHHHVPERDAMNGKSFRFQVFG